MVGWPSNQRKCKQGYTSLGVHFLQNTKYHIKQKISQTNAKNDSQQTLLHTVTLGQHCGISPPT